MPFALLLSLFPSIFGYAAASQSDQVRTLVVQEDVIMRVPVRPRLLPPALEWVEKKGPDCIAADEIRAAARSGREHVDFLLTDRRRMRARLADDCPALDFYSGFYLRPERGEICERRDSIHSRIGGSCRIEKFRSLVPRLRR